jgi:1-acyl-sn-glycerol-3-phosphate acyltransferase
VISSARRAARIATFAAITPTMLAGYSLDDLRRHLEGAEKRELRDRWFGAWCEAMLRVFGIRVIVLGDRRARGRGRLVVSNHRGVADVLVLLRTFGGCMVSRADIARWPVIGLAGKKLGTVFVDRADIRSGASSIRAMKSLLASGETVSIFPEGTTFAGDEVRPFHAGGFVAAQSAAADIVPVGLAYAKDSQAAFLDESFPQHLARMAAAPASSVVVSIGEPLEVPEKARSKDVAALAREAVAREVTKARARAS